MSPPGTQGRLFELPDLPPSGPEPSSAPYQLTNQPPGVNPRFGANREPPSTRYQGSKRKLLKWIGDSLRDFPARTVLDLFGGTASVSYSFKREGKAVTYNDYLRFNHWIGTALIENSRTRLSSSDMEFVCRRDPGSSYDDFIARTFQGIYFTDEENHWLDTACQNIPRLPDPYRQALAYYALFQAALRKRPYNLFHRRNLYMRTAKVRRGFGNKATWDSPFEDQFREFADIANRAVIDCKVECRAICQDALDVSPGYDLVYIDPPYVSGAGVGVDYLAFYHFLEGMIDYPHWEARLDTRRKHLPLLGSRSPWSDPKQIRAQFERLFALHAESILCVSYRSDGIPSEAELLEMLREVKTHVKCLRHATYQYALSTNQKSDELLLIGW